MAGRGNDLTDRTGSPGLRLFWPALADTVATAVPVAAAQDQVHRHARHLGWAARDLKEKSLDR